MEQIIEQARRPGQQFSDHRRTCELKSGQKQVESETEATQLLEAAVLDVWAHGRAAEKKEQVGLLAGDLPPLLGEILSG